MRYQMRQKLLSWGSDFTIRDASDRDVFRVDGKALSLRNRLVFEDLDGNELATIQRRLLSFGPTYEIHRDGRLHATVARELFTLFRTKFEVDVPGPDDLKVRGNFLEREYEFRRTTDDAVVAAVSKRWFGWTDSYGVDVADGQDDVLILCATVVIDQVVHEQD